MGTDKSNVNNFRPKQKYYYYFEFQNKKYKKHNYFKTFENR